MNGCLWGGWGKGGGSNDENSWAKEATVEMGMVCLCVLGVFVIMRNLALRKML